MFLSINSKIVKKQLLQIDETNTGLPIIFVSETGLTPDRIIFAILLMK